MIWGLDPNDVVSSHVNPPYSPQASWIIDTQFSSDSKMQQRSNVSMAAIHDTHRYHSHVDPRFRGSNFDGLFVGESRDWTGSSLTATVGKPQTNKLSQRGGWGSDQVNSSQAGDEQLQHLRRCEYDNDTVMHVPLQTPPTNDRNLDFETLSAEALGIQSFLSESLSNIQHGSTNHGSQSNSTRSEKVISPKLIELLHGLLQLFDRFADLRSGNLQRKYRTSSAMESALNYLPTPPSSASPRWSSVFSPIQRFSLVSEDASQSEKWYSNDNEGNELSDDLCHLVYDPATPESTPFRISVPNIGNSPLEETISTVYETPKFSSPAMSSMHPPSLSVPPHIVSLKHALSSPDASSMANPSNPCPVLHARSTLKNQMYIPLSHLRPESEARKLAPVLEEVVLHSPDVLPQPPLRTLSPPDFMLRVQTIDETPPLGENPDSTQPRVKLPPKVIATKRNNYDVNPALVGSVSPREYPAKNASQEQKKVTKLAQKSQVGFPPVSEKIASFNLMNTPVRSSSFRKMTNVV
jgi:hypothetical protein